MKKFLITVIIGCLTTAVSEAATYYVAKTGSNSNTCTQAQSQSTPKLTLTAGASCLVAGDTLYIKAGTYSETGGSIQLPTAASWGAATTISIFGSDVVTFQSSVNPFKLYNNAAAYVIFNGFVFDGTSSGAVDGIATGSITSHLRFTNIEVKNSVNNGILGGGDGNEFINCSVHDNGILATGGLGNGAHGMYLAGINTLVDHCEVYNNAYYGIHVYNSPGGVNNNTVRNSLVHNNNTSGAFAAGILLSSGTGNAAYNNIVYGNFGGIQIGATTMATGSKVYNNTIYGNVHWAIDLETPSTGAIIKNNIMYNNESDIANSGTGTIQSNNLFKATNPLFVNAAGHDFHLQSGSPAIDAGVDLSSQGVTTDLAGGTRPQGCCFDIGAYEYGSSLNLIAPSNLIAGP